MRLFRYLSLAITSLFVLHSCGTVALTGRKQVLLYDDNQLLELSAQSYDEFNATTTQSKDLAATARVKAIGDRMVAAMEEYFTKTSQVSYMKGLNWRIDLVESDEVNAFALPSGNIVIYEPMLKVASSDDMLATVIGHEMAHAIAKHSNERMSTSSIVQSVSSIASSILSNSKNSTESKVALFNIALGLGSKYGVEMPFSRKQEFEADRIGLILMAIAGYDIEQAPELWKKMSSNGASIPEFLSTHPSDEHRIENLYKCMDEARTYIAKK